MTSDLDGWIAWGASGHAKVVRDCITAVPLVAVFDNAEVRAPFADIPLLGGRDGFARWRAETPGRFGFVIAIGGTRGEDRCHIHRWLVTEGLVPITATHRTAFVAASARVGAGCHVLAQSAICVDATLGVQCIVNTGATIDHECQLGDGVHVAPGAHIAGCVAIGDHAFVGIGASVVPRVTIGRRAIVGAGAVVIGDVAPDTTVAGNPARPIERKA
jgi:sugar O-acyltransferase (sialic acid O-acetyltransferase NeuD family)